MRYWTLDLAERVLRTYVAGLTAVELQRVRTRLEDGWKLVPGAYFSGEKGACLLGIAIFDSDHRYMSASANSAIFMAKELANGTLCERAGEHHSAAEVFDSLIAWHPAVEGLLRRILGLPCAPTS